MAALAGNLGNLVSPPGVVRVPQAGAWRLFGNARAVVQAGISAGQSTSRGGRLLPGRSWPVYHGRRVRVLRLVDGVVGLAPRGGVHPGAARPITGDALEEAGCPEEPILNHCSFAVTAQRGPTSPTHKPTGGPPP
jgi:hypothetical protein